VDTPVSTGTHPDHFPRSALNNQPVTDQALEASRQPRVRTVRLVPYRYARSA